MPAKLPLMAIGNKDALDLGPMIRTGDGFMLSLVQFAPVAHLPDVDRVLQELRQ